MATKKKSTFESRLLKEVKDLQKKTDDLGKFLGKGKKVVISTAGMTQYELMEKQLKAMRSYLEAVKERVTNLGLDVK